MSRSLPPNGRFVVVSCPGLRNGLFALCWDAPIWLTKTQSGPSSTVAAKLRRSVSKNIWCGSISFARQTRHPEPQTAAALTGPRAVVRPGVQGREVFTLEPMPAKPQRETLRPYRVDR